MRGAGPYRCIRTPASAPRVDPPPGADPHPVAPLAWPGFASPFPFVAGLLRRGSLQGPTRGAAEVPHADTMGVRPPPTWAGCLVRRGFRNLSLFVSGCACSCAAGPSWGWLVAQLSSSPLARGAGWGLLALSAGWGSRGSWTLARCGAAAFSGPGAGEVALGHGSGGSGIMYTLRSRGCQPRVPGPPAHMGLLARALMPQA